MIVDLSWPCGSSVNDGIPSGTFLGELLELTYPTIDAIVPAIVSLSWGYMLYKRDLRKAYRQFPVDPHDYHLLGYTWNRQFYFDSFNYGSPFCRDGLSTLHVRSLLDSQAART